MAFFMVVLKLILYLTVKLETYTTSGFSKVGKYRKLWGHKQLQRGNNNKQ